MTFSRIIWRTGYEKHRTASAVCRKIDSGYQIEYSTDKGFADNTKTVNVKGSNKAKKKIAKLEKRKVYYVRIRSYAKTGQSTSYSDWSKQLKVKTK